MAFQHLAVVFFLLLVLNLYLKADSVSDKPAYFYFWWALTLLANLAASFSRLSILIIPLAIGAHILLSDDSRQRIIRYTRWLPLFITYLGYPLFLLMFAGEDRLNIDLTGWNAPFKYPIAVITGIVLLFGLRAVFILFRNDRPNPVIKKAVLIAAVCAVYLVLCLKGVKYAILPFDIWVPFTGMLSTFLQPLQSAFLIDSTRHMHFIYLQMSLFNFLLVVFIVMLFVKRNMFRTNTLAMLVVWYFLAYGYLMFQNPIRSRYFIFISPIFSIVISSAAIYLLGRAKGIIKERFFMMEMCMLSLFFIFCSMNIAAIRF
ncbi:MAG: hypothetical protein COV72_01615, partial [Candidatus Omnitrophica bacterium CG11_big_fil_rev_8_21_14_0_20_42_13]